MYCSLYKCSSVFRLVFEGSKFHADQSKLTTLHCVVTEIIVTIELEKIKLVLQMISLHLFFSTIPAICVCIEMV